MNTASSVAKATTTSYWLPLKRLPLFGIQPAHLLAHGVLFTGFPPLRPELGRIWWGKHHQGNQMLQKTSRKMQSKLHHFFLPGFRGPRKSRGEDAVGDCLFLLEQAVFKRKKRNVLIFKIWPFPSILSPLQASIQRFIFSLRHFSFWNYFTKSMIYIFSLYVFWGDGEFPQFPAFSASCFSRGTQNTLLQLHLPEWSPRARGWMAMFVLRGLDALGGTLPCVQMFMLLGKTESLAPGEEQSVIRWPACWAGLHFLKPRVWCCPEEGSWSKSPPSLAVSGQRIWASHSYILCCLQKYGGDFVPSTLLPAHFLEAIL